MKKRKRRFRLDRLQKRKAEKIYRDHGAAVLGIAAGFVKDPAAAEDAAVETFVRMMPNIDKLDETDAARTRGYLAVIVRNVCMDMLKKSGECSEPDALLDGTEPADTSPGPEELAVNREMIERLAEEIKAMPTIYRDVFLLKTVYRHSTVETAETLGITPEAAAKRFTRARAMLKKRLEGYLND